MIQSNPKSMIIGIFVLLGTVGWMSVFRYEETGESEKILTASATVVTAGKVQPDSADKKIYIQNISYKPGQKYVVTYAGESPDDRLIFTATDRTGKPLAGVRIEFQLIDYPAKAKDYFFTPEAITDSSGRVYPFFRAGTESGTYTLIARTEHIYGPLPKVTIRVFDQTWLLFMLFGVFGGLGIFLYGMGVGSGGLQKVAGDKLRLILGRLTRTPLIGVILGTGITAIVQSSSATVVMVIGFISASLMTLSQGLSVMLGAHIGTTLTVQLIAFNISDYALLMIGTGFLMTLITKRKMFIYIGEVILGFGFIFFGMSVMSLALGPLKSLPVVTEQLMAFGQNPLTGILFAALFTGIIQSSGATIGLAVVLANEGLLDLSVGLPLVLGANIGTTVTGLLASGGADINGKRAALANMLFSIIGVILMYPLISYFNSIVVHFTAWFGSDSPARQIANSHMLFNVVNAFILVWFIGAMARLVVRWIPEKQDGIQSEMRTIYLNNDLLEIPELAIEQSCREIYRLNEKIHALFMDVHEQMIYADEERAEHIAKEIQVIYFIENEVRKYYTRLSQKNISLFQSKRLMAFLLILDDLRRITYILGENIPERLTHGPGHKVRFSEDGLKDLKQYYAEILDIFMKTTEVIRSEKPEAAQQVLELKKHISHRETELREKHIERLRRGQPESIETSAVHLDILSLLKRIDSYCNRINHSIIDQYNLYKKK